MIRHIPLHSNLASHTRAVGPDHTSSRKLNAALRRTNQEQIQRRVHVSKEKSICVDLTKFGAVELQSFDPTSVLEYMNLEKAVNHGENNAKTTSHMFFKDHQLGEL